MLGRNMLQMMEPVNIDGSATEDFKVMAHAAQNLGVHMYGALMFSLHTGSILQYLAVIAAVYLFVINRTNWRTDILTSLLVPYIFLNLPDFLFHYIRGEIGLWIAFVAVVVKLFFPAEYYPDHADLPVSLLLLLVTAPSLVVKLRFHYAGIIISVLIGGYLLFEHIKNAGGFKAAFTSGRVIISIGILLLFVAPFWQLFWSIF